MPQLVNGNTSWEGTININKQSGTIIELSTGNKFISKPIDLEINVTDSNLVAGNIKSGSSILGVNGSYTNDATAASSDILTGKTAYVNGTKITGSMVIATVSEARSYLGLT